MSINQIAKMLKVKRNEIFEIMKKEGFVFDKEQGFFVNINEDSLIKRVEKLEQQQREILELLSNTKQKNELKIDNDILNGEIVQKSYKLNKEIAERFSDYCKELRGSGIKSQDILSMALLEFLNKRNR
nr:phage antirepressor KilAC domain-containing protein [Clostridium perfringens]